MCSVERFFFCECFCLTVKIAFVPASRVRDTRQATTRLMCASLRLYIFYSILYPTLRAARAGSSVVRDDAAPSATAWSVFVSQHAVALAPCSLGMPLGLWVAHPLSVSQTDLLKELS